MIAIVIGVRANATAIDVPSSSRSVRLRSEDQRQERVVASSRRCDAPS